MPFSGCDNKGLQMQLILLPIVFLCLVEAGISSSRPETVKASRAVALKHGRRPSPEAARSVLDRGEHDANLG